MWRASKRIVVDCFWSLARCLNPASIINELEDISIYEIEDIPDNLQSQNVVIEQQQRQAEPLQHRPDTPVSQRRSPPEVVSKVRQAIEEMTGRPNREVPPGDHFLFIQQNI
ncbi:hypothetical protein HCN44_007303 [Aphidius gifuensis]|uniref:Uncharacterized protein n=1 Tax=Aphidius gifuensis TaxID=684658 RepID=A0A834XKQ6_APHGI|nr:hypothetical protein HCN44_007303 [Aphidius gifuensis]